MKWAFLKNWQITGFQVVAGVYRANGENGVVFGIESNGGGLPK